MSQQGFLDLRPAEVWGRLFVWQPGIPILKVPDEQILLTGTRHLAGDLIAAGGVQPPAPTKRPAGRGWRRIQGELIVFPDAEPRMRLLDAFEGVHPAPSAQTYERVLLPIRLHDPKPDEDPWTTAWCYILPPFADDPDEAIAADHWQPGLGT